jgi:hypothetical protein
MLHKFQNAVRFYLLNRVCRINPAPLFVLGNQKSGTSAIGALLAQALQASLTLDLIVAPGHARDLLAAHRDSAGFAAFVRRRKYEFSKEVIKEPNLTLLQPRLREYFPGAGYVFVVRDPRDTIRSILDRLEVAGDLEDNPGLDHVRPRIWKLFFEIGCPDPERYAHYIDRLAWRWNSMVDIYCSSPEPMELVKYEDFVRDKAGVIHALAAKVGARGSLQELHHLDEQYQPPGRSRERSREDFFGPDNLQRIETICRERMELLEYREF